MDNQRLFTWGLFGLLFFMTWQAWQLDYNTPQPAASVDPAIATPATNNSQVPTGGESDLPTLAVEPQPANAASAELPSVSTAEPVESIRVVTDVFDVTIDLKGGDVSAATMLRYPVDKKTPDKLVTLLSSDPIDFGRFQTGLVLTEDPKSGPTHFARFTAPRTEYRLDGANELTVPLSWSNAAGLKVTKVYIFRPGSYQIDLRYDIENASDAAVTAVPYGQIVKSAKKPERSMVDVETYSFDGPVVFNGDSYDKVSIDDLEDGDPQQFVATNGWIASIRHHFLSAIIPPAGNEWRYDVTLRNGLYNVNTIGQQAAVAVAPGASDTVTTTLFVGPKLQDQLEAIAPKLKLTVDYGILTLLAQPLFWLLDHVHDIVKNWGWSIIIVTLLIKLLFYRLTAASGRSMAKMRNLQPRMKKLQERYKDDRQALSREMMELYKREKVNPAAGCLPILVQMPFFLAFYWVLLESVEMRQAPFALWITDLSTRDPFFVLPLMMGAAMLVQTKLNPAPADPIQARVMTVLPVIFTVFFAFFPAGLVLYWLTNTLLSIAQQWRINKLVEAESKAASTP